MGTGGQVLGAGRAGSCVKLRVRRAGGRDARAQGGEGVRRAKVSWDRNEDGKGGRDVRLGLGPRDEVKLDSRPGTQPYAGSPMVWGLRDPGAG